MTDLSSCDKEILDPILSHWDKLIRQVELRTTQDSGQVLNESQFLKTWSKPSQNSLTIKNRV